MASLFHGPPDLRPGVAARSLIVSIVGAAQLLSGCMSVIPHTDYASPRSNGSVEYVNPSFHHRINWFGWTFIGAMTAGGAYEGYRSDMALRWQGWQQSPETKPGGNIAIGALAGLASALLLTHLVGGGDEPVTTDNAAEWLDGINNRMMLLPSAGNHPGMPLRSINAIARDADASYTIRSIDDARFFLETFPGSRYRDGALADFVQRLTRDSLLGLASAVRGLPAEELAIIRWIDGLSTFDEAIKGVGAIGASHPALARRASELAAGIGDLRRFMLVFQGSPFVEAMAARIGTHIERSEIPGLLDLVPAIRTRADLLGRYLDGSRSTSEAIETMRRYPETREQADRRAASLARSLDDYKAYVDAFPDGLRVREMQRKIDQEELDRKEGVYRYDGEYRYDDE